MKLKVYEIKSRDGEFKKMWVVKFLKMWGVIFNGKKG